ncbi:MAG: regulatory protein RecX, partial [Burkholderiales bacterium]
RKFGAARIAHELRAKGLDRGLAAQASQAARATEVERAREVWRRKFRASPRTDEERAKQMRFLQSRGFSFDAIHAVLGRSDDD